MLLRLSFFVCLPLLASSFLFPSSGGSGCCCCNSGPTCIPCTPTCRPCAPAPSCGCGGYSSGCSNSCGGGGSSYAQSSYASAPQQSSYVSAPQSSYVSAPSYASSGGYAKSSYSSGPAPSYSAPQPSYSGASYGGAPQQASYNGPPQSSQSYSQNVAENIPPPPIPAQQPSEVIPAETASDSGSYSVRTASASASKIQPVEEEITAKEELSVVASSVNATAIIATDPSPPIDISLLKLTNDTECNSEELREIVNKNMNENLNASKRLIQLAAEEKFGGRFDVICSTNDFSYVTNTELFCQHTNTFNHVSCYAYRQL